MLTALDSIFARQEPIEIEVGTGKGLFLASAAQTCPSNYFVGLELAAKYADAAQLRLDRLEIGNAKVFACDAVQIMSERVPSSRVAAVHVYFPDPWWKRKHKKRRVLSDQMLVSIERVLISGGQLHFWTDVLDYYEDTIQRIDQIPSLSGPYYVEEPHSTHDMDFRTHFERRTRLNGLPVYRARYEKT